MTYSIFDLKYCERCGGLGLRRNNSGLSYCRPCTQMMRDFSIRPNPALVQRSSRLNAGLRRVIFSRPFTASAQGATYGL